MPALGKNLGNMIIGSISHNKKQKIGLKADINQRFDTQIHILDDLTNSINLDQQNLRDVIERRSIQHQVDMTIITEELKQSQNIVNSFMTSIVTPLAYVATPTK